MIEIGDVCAEHAFNHWELVLIPKKVGPTNKRSQRGWSIEHSVNYKPMIGQLGNRKLPDDN
jgi:hypothetical protein